MIRGTGIIFPYASKVSGKRSEKMTVIFDFKNVNVMKFLTGDMKNFMSLGAACS